MSSVAGQSSTFWFAIPLAHADDRFAAEAVTRPVPARTGRLLLVEDLALNRLLACALLEEEGYQVRAVTSGEEAIEPLRTQACDLVLMDVQMPGMAGIAATKAIRSLPSCGTVPIIAMTANVLPDQIKASLDAGMDDHVGKPIDRTELSTTNARWLAPLPPSHHPIFDERIFEDISMRLGATRTRDALRMFSLDLQSRFVATSLDMDETFLSDAHIVTSISGILGFTDLPRRRTQLASGQAGDEGYRTKALGILRAKKQALARLKHMLSVEPEAAVV